MSDTRRASCNTLRQSALAAVDWINDDDNKATVGLERKSVDRRLRRLIVETNKLERSLDRPMCVGVFGPSQAGKSYLVSVLARHGEEPLGARFDGLAEPLDFIHDINPGGDRESTGIVTRFSIRGIKSPPGYPVNLRLLSETDVIKIIGNCYFNDGDQKLLPPASPEGIEAAFKAVRGKAGSSRPADNQLSVEDILDLQEYFERTFEGTRNIEALRNYWDEAIDLAPQLGLEDRAGLFSLLWGGLEQFTWLYTKLTGALAQLGFAETAFATIEALIPRDESIIDVQTLSGLTKEGQSEISVQAANGTQLSLPRPLVTALVAELHIEVSRQPWPFFAHTDLLDFPGARPRQVLNLEEFLQDSDKDPLKELLIRGKVAYLFERYVAEQELTSMLLCVKPSNQDVVTLPDMINDWIKVSHGETPDLRRNKTVVLFLILTWFDAHFVEKAGENSHDPGERFKSRIYSSIESFFGKAHNWPSNWVDGQHFNNTYWLRNPGIKAESIISYEGKKELAIRPDKQDYIDWLREGYLQTESVNRYISDPARAFDEALKLNDGGVTYLAERLEPVCKPGLQVEQTSARIRSIAKQLRGLLDPFHVSSDIDKRLAERRAVSQQILTHVQRLYAEGRFADLLAALLVSQHEMSAVLYDYMMRRSRDDGAGSAAPAKPVTPKASPAAAGGPGLPPMPVMPPMPGIPPMPGMPAMPGEVPASAQTAPADIAFEDKNDPFMGMARRSVELWMGSMRKMAETEQLGRFFENDSAISEELVSEICTAARRLELERIVRGVLAGLAGSVSEELDRVIEKASFGCAATINRFVTRMGYDLMAEQDRPKAPNASGGVQPVFVHPKAANCASEIDLGPATHGYSALSDWMYAFHALVESNAKSVDGQSFDVEQNARIGQVLENIETVMT